MCSEYDESFSELDDKSLVEQMLSNSSSHLWIECYEFVHKKVYLLMRNVEMDYKDDVIQEVMIRIYKSLPRFGYKCSFKTWIISITRNCVIDTYREQKRIPKDRVDLSRYYNEIEDSVMSVYVTKPLEDEYMIREKCVQALLARKEYLSIHSNSVRNEQILDLVLFNDCSLGRAAKSVGCSTAVAGYVVREAQKFIRKKLEMASDAEMCKAGA